MDIVIVATNTEVQAEHWQKYLDYYSTKSCKYYVVNEDWEGGADNGLGTLYAYKKCSKQALKEDEIDFDQVLEENGSISLFHCAGKGKRLFPLTASERNNKSAIKVPSENGLKTILEKVIDISLNQTDALKGRLSVFWGDQIFLPTKVIQPLESHIQIFSMMGEFPTEKKWHEKKMQNYGLIIESEKQARLVEKTTYTALKRLVKGSDAQVGMSLGSFSISKTCLNILLQTFEKELEEKRGQLNTDYHFWMPLTWEKDEYCQFMLEKGESVEATSKVYDTMQKVKQFLETKGGLSVFTAQDIGEDAFWWDFGNLTSYSQNFLDVLKTSTLKSKKFSEIFGLTAHYHPDTNSILYNCDVEDLDVKNCVLFNVRAKKIKACDSIVINADLHELEAKESLLYSICEPSFLNMESGDVRADIFFETDPKQISLYTNIYRDNKKDWEVCLPKNSFSFSEIHFMNEDNFHSENVSKS